MKPKSKLHRKAGSKQAGSQLQITTKPSAFSFTIAKVAVSQICQSVGFKSAQRSALEMLTNIATLYLKALAKTAASYCNSSNRTQPNLFDLIGALYELTSVQGSLGASTLHNGHNCLLGSSLLKDLSVFLNSTDEIPFARPIPRSNSIPPPKNTDSLDLNSRGVHIPSWLPGFPDESTYTTCNGTIREEEQLRGDLVLWEKSDLVRSSSRIGNENVGKSIEYGKNRRSGGSVLAAARRRVRFKIGGVEKGKGMAFGVDTRNWVCRGVESVCWNESSNVSDEGHGCFKKKTWTDTALS